MYRIVYYIVLGSLAILTASAFADSLSMSRLQLIENQRNIIYLHKEKRLYQKELQVALSNPQANNSVDIQALKDDIALADILIANISHLASQQRLALATLETGSPPSTLDIALNKALSANLSDLAKKLPNNKAAKKEIAHLYTLLKQQAYVGTPTLPTQTSVFLANKQHVAEAEFLKLLSLFSAGSTDEFEDKPIKITWISDRTPYEEEEVLSYLGHGQYHLETTVYYGKMTLTVDGRPWQLNIPIEEDNANYVIIYDNVLEAEPRVVMFNKLLLLE